MVSLGPTAGTVQIFSVSSSPVNVPQIKYGCIVEKKTKAAAWRWLDVSSSIFKCSEKVRSLLSSLQFSIMEIPVKDVSNSLSKGIEGWGLINEYWKA
nr:acylamino-acid-releasing enzyme 2 [Quercus suber]